MLMESEPTEGRASAPPTWRAKCRMLGSGRPLRFELLGRREDLPPTNPRPIASRESKLNDEQHEGHKIYTGSGHRYGVIPYSSVWCGGLPQGLMMNSTRGRTASREVFLSWCGVLVGRDLVLVGLVRTQCLPAVVAISIYRGPGPLAKY